MYYLELYSSRIFIQHAIRYFKIAFIFLVIACSNDTENINEPVFTPNSNLSNTETKEEISISSNLLSKYEGIYMFERKGTRKINLCYFHLRQPAYWSRWIRAILRCSCKQYRSISKQRRGLPIPIQVQFWQHSNFCLLRKKRHIGCKKNIVI